jgi:hypothetical protein
LTEREKKMAKEIAVHKGTYGEGTPQERPAAWVETSLLLDPESHDFVDALGSRFLRFSVIGDDQRVTDRPQDLPESLEQREITKIYREEIRRYGEEYMSLWSNEMGWTQQESYRKWLMEVVLDAFPEMKGYEVK